MSKEHHDLEILALAHVTKSTKSLDLFLERKITTEHFTYVPDGDSVSYTQGLFNMILKYYEQSGGSLFTSYILDQKLKNKKVKESSKAKLLTLWEDIENSDVDDNNLYEIIQQLKNRRCNTLLSEMLTDSYSSFASQDIKTTLSVIQDNVDKIQEEINNIKKASEYISSVNTDNIKGILKEISDIKINLDRLESSNRNNYNLFTSRVDKLRNDVLNNGKEY